MNRTSVMKIFGILVCALPLFFSMCNSDDGNGPVDACEGKVLCLTNPTGETPIKVGETVTITWQADPNGGLVGILAKLSINGGRTFAFSLNGEGEQAPVDGTLSWTVTDDQIGAECVIRIMDYFDNTIKDDSPKFAITAN